MDLSFPSNPTELSRRYEHDAKQGERCGEAVRVLLGEELLELGRVEEGLTATSDRAHVGFARRLPVT
jgi:hypothetical protein